MATATFQACMKLPETKADKIIRSLLSDATNLREFCLVFDPEFASQLDFETVQTLPLKSFDQDLREIEADLILLIRSKSNPDVENLLLLEHQSTPDRTMPMRILNYLSGIWRRVRSMSRHRGSSSPPSVVLIVFYSGARVWQKKPQLADLLPAVPVLSDQGGPLHVVYWDLNYKRVKDLLAAPYAVAWFLAVARIGVSQPDTCARVTALALLRLEQGPLDEDRFEDIVRYMVGWILGRQTRVVCERILEQATRRLNSANRSFVMELYNVKIGTSVDEDIIEGFEKGKVIGWTKGRREGRKEGRVEGRMEGRMEGRVEGLRLALIELLELRIGSLPDSLAQEIGDETDHGRLFAAIGRAASVRSIDDFTW